MGAPFPRNLENSFSVTSPGDGVGGSVVFFFFFCVFGVFFFGFGASMKSSEVHLDSDVSPSWYHALSLVGGGFSFFHGAQLLIFVDREPFFFILVSRSATRLPSSVPCTRSSAMRILLF